MKQAIIKKAIFQTAISLAISILYMQLLSQSYMKISWPLSFLALIFIAIDWFLYLQHDGFTIPLDFMKRNKPKKEKKIKTMIDYTDTDVKHIEDFDDQELYKIKMFSNGITAILLFIISLIV